MTSLTIGLAQMYPKLGDLRFNLQQHLDYIARAQAEGVDLLIFPELSMTGYQVQDLMSEVAMKPSAEDPIFGQLLAASATMDLVIGFVHEDRRQRFYIAQAYLSGGAVLHVHHKLYLPTYGMFDDGRYFDAGDHIRAFDTRFGRIGMLICEDYWHPSAAYVLWMDGADMQIYTSASPTRGIEQHDEGNLSVARWSELATRLYGSAFTSYIVHVNRVGYEDGKNFWGGSLVVNPEGDFLTHGRYFDEALIVQSIDLNQLHRTRARLPLLRDERPELTLRELGRILNVPKP